MEAVLFDLGNTLIYFDGDWPATLPQSDGELLRYLRNAGINLDGRQFLQQFRRELDNYFIERETEFIERTTAYLLRSLLSQWGYPNVPEKVIREALQAMYAVTQAYWKPEAEALSTLQTLKQDGFHLGMISNAGDDADVQVLVDKAELRPFFDFILTSAGQGIRKPNPLIFQTALDYWEIGPSQAVMVGDTLGADILGAQNAGIYSIWITRRADTPANRAHEDTIKPDSSIDNLDELPELIKSLNHRLSN
jgi:HAD superfamily hydrolase (TIGR01549 family)